MAPPPLFSRCSMATTTAPKSLFLASHRLALPTSLCLRLRRTFTHPVVRCVFSADEFVDSRPSGGGSSQPQWQFLALADVAQGIELLDTQVVGKGVFTAAKDSMKRTISAMLGLLPSHQFRVSYITRGSERNTLAPVLLLTTQINWINRRRIRGNGRKSVACVLRRQTR